MDVSVALSETPPTDIVPYEEPEQKKAEREADLRLRLHQMLCSRVIAARDVERAKGLKAKWGAIVEDTQHDMLNLEDGLRGKRKKLAHAETLVKQKDTLIAKGETQLNDLDIDLVMLEEELGEKATRDVVLFK